MDRVEVLDFINEVLVANRGDVSTEDTILRDNGMDSFAFVILLLELDEKYRCFDVEYTSSIPSNVIETLTSKRLIDRVEECS